MNINVAIAQVTSRPLASEHNRGLTVDVIQDAFARGARLVVLPELIVSGYVLDAAQMRTLAEPLEGPTLAAWQTVASTHGGYIVGGFCERAGENLYNTGVLVGPRGLELHYRKLHLFEHEKAIFTPGDLGLPLAETPLGMMGVCICYDLRFVETARALALFGARIIAVPCSWENDFDPQPSMVNGYYPQARNAMLQAGLDQVFIACASQAGSDGEREFLGSSLVADPYGRTLLGPLSTSEPALALTKIDLDEVGRAQQRAPLITPRADRRKDVYALWVEGVDL
ncbi:MAG: hypothetical protein GWN84_18605 [Gammaproteobacteria bacterium]|nr:hypothetical protein [Gammaproteobacteria bacterium]NIR84842.1 hypothetical protein [Gammaproteobacteria bacterium]NIR91556.1 hypothetical protein [Gammaproteobacteria bacterium]NIU05889.1 hypothetical protein [Gammaproteobacteria bacterium]NIV76744.1 hypothetical protein [Gammaproteobacteria bacterium]